MTEALYHVDSYMKEFTATVSEVVGNGVVLDRSAFYPGGGGQPGDTGLLRSGDAEYRVTKISRKDGKVVHELDGEPPPAGTQVAGAIDWERRYQLMRTHTALHILCGVVWRDFGAQVTGGDMQPLSARMDFELEHMSIDLLPKGIKEVRVVDINGLDLQADGGTHVANTSEVRRIKVVGHESKGRISKRLRIQVEE